MHHQIIRMRSRSYVFVLLPQQELPSGTSWIIFCGMIAFGMFLTRACAADINAFTGVLTENVYMYMIMGAHRHILQRSNRRHFWWNNFYQNICWALLLELLFDLI